MEVGGERGCCELHSQIQIRHATGSALLGHTQTHKSEWFPRSAQLFFISGNKLSKDDLALRVS